MGDHLSHKHLIAWWRRLSTSEVAAHAGAEQLWMEVGAEYTIVYTPAHDPSNISSLLRILSDE
jgi:hypothetical protein